ncbi:MAG: FimV/HubP family polar landmark protein [Luteimonas sp.]
MAIALAFAGPAAALGLGQIRVKSQPGQPLLAEIPIISSDPSELEGLQAQLASPETFRRVGLEPPQGAASSLRFEPAIDAAGRPVIRVTSTVPIQQPLLTFLLEVDWGQGRLVREYSALVDAPRTVAAPTQPPIQAPTVAPSNTIVRPQTPAVVAAPTPVPAPRQGATPVPPKPPAPRAAPAAPPPPSPVAVAPQPAPATATPSPTPVASARSDEYGPVKAGQTLGEIAAGLGATQGHSVAQTMLALLRANPEAFIGGNINQLKRGAVLRLPQSADLDRVDQRQAAALVHEQIVQWRAARGALPQPAQVAAAPSGTVSAARKPAENAPARTAGARLEIVPPSAGRGQQAGTRSGMQAGGEGEMLRQQLQETKETLAARDAEVAELKTRVADLEKLQQQQQQLITMKDSALATAQQKLAQSNAAPATPAKPAQTQAATAQQHAVAATAQAQAQASNGTPWLWGGALLLLTAVVGWLWSRRRPTKPVSPLPRRNFDTQALAASLVPPVAPPVQTDVVPPDVHEDVATVETVGSGPVSAAVQEAVAPTWHGASPAATSPPEPTASDAGQQLELAQAYLDLGDEDAARALLRDVLNGRDPAARDRAARLLRDL